MTSKRHQRRKQCDGKVGHASPGAAWAHVQSLARIGQHGVLPYPCCACGKWHVGHRPKKLTGYRPGASKPDIKKKEEPNQ